MLNRPIYFKYHCNAANFYLFMLLLCLVLVTNVAACVCQVEYTWDMQYF